MSSDLAAARAFLDADKNWDALAAEQQATVTRRRSILGSLEETYALNRHERGAA